MSIGWSIVSLLVLPFVAVALASAGGWIDLPYELAAIEERIPLTFRLHMLCAAAALVLIPAALAVRRAPRWHRPIGRVAVAAVLVGGLTAIPVGLHSLANGAARAGFVTKAVAWLVLVVAGYVAIRRRKVHAHAMAMSAMVAVTSAAIWARPAMVAARGLPVDFDVLYAGIVWAGWLVPLGLTLAWWWRRPVSA